MDVNTNRHTHEDVRSQRSRRRRAVRRRRATLAFGLLAVASVLAVAWSTGSGTAVRGDAGHSRRGRRNGGSASTIASSPVATTRAPVAIGRGATRREDAAVKRLARRTWFVNRAGPHPREVALTFDDGPGPYTERVLDVLDRYHVPATFFEVGSMIRYFNDALKRQIREHDVLGDHTEDHMDLDGKPRSVQLSEIDGVKEWYRRYHAPAPLLFRAPYGAWDATTRQLIKRMGMLAVFWSVDTEDWRQPGVGVIVHNALGVHPGGIVLMHDAGGTRTQTIAALPTIIKRLRARGLRLVTVPRLLADTHPRHVGRAPLATGVG